MIDYIDNNDKKQLAGKQGYNDKPQRDAFKRMASEGGCEVTRNYLVVTALPKHSLIIFVKPAN